MEFAFCLAPNTWVLQDAAPGGAIDSTGGTILFYCFTIGKFGQTRGHFDAAIRRN
jgi:hypothetical protein